MNVKVINLLSNRKNLDKNVSVFIQKKSYLQVFFCQKKNISIKNSYIGIASKDESTIRGLKIDISDSKIGLAAYQKKSEFGPGKIELKEMNSK